MAVPVTIFQAGNRLVVDPTTPDIYELLAPHLSFVAKKFLYGKERRMHDSRVMLEHFECFSRDHKNRLACPLGFYDKIVALLTKAGHETTRRILTPPAKPSIFQARWDRIFDPRWKLELRYGQKKFLEKLAERVALGLPSRFDCPPAFGKSFMIGSIAMMYPEARIHVISKRVAVLRDRIYPELCGMLPGVGLIGGGKNDPHGRIVCFTFDSLHRSDGNADLLICDESHEASADRISAEIGGRYDRAIGIGLSATHDMRIDGKDMRSEAMFGPVVYKMGYDEAMKQGLVVPLEVHWSNVIMNNDPCDGFKDETTRVRRAIWRNKIRNQLIAADARRYDENTQVLITCATVEHAMTLKRHLPEFTLVHAEGAITSQERAHYISKGMMLPDEPEMTQERRQLLTRQFEQKELMKVICTTVWNVGVNFQHLQVLIRADAGGSPIMDTQIPGRTSRLSPDRTKDIGLVHDYLDQFNKGFQMKARGRYKSYAANNWKQILPNGDTEPAIPE